MSAETPTVAIVRPDDEHIEVHVNGQVVATANHDAHGWSGMDAVERTALAVTAAFTGDGVRLTRQPTDQPTDQQVDHRFKAAEFAAYAEHWFGEDKPADAQAAAAISQAYAALAALDVQERTAAALEDLVRLATEVPDGEL